MNASRHLAGEIINKANRGDYKEWIRIAYETLFAREETDSERGVGRSFLMGQAASLKAEGRQPASLATPEGLSGNFDSYKGAALVDYCLALFNLNEMIYLD